MSNPTIFIIDDHKIVRDGLKAMLLARPSVKVVGEAASGSEAIEKLENTKADLYFVDWKLPDITGAELIIKIKEINPDAKCALLTADPSPMVMQQAENAGALAFLTKDIDSQEYFVAIDKLLKGKKHVSPIFADILLNDRLKYSPREIEVLQGFANGLSYKEIGAHLNISPRTVESHKNNLLDKMKVKSVMEMVKCGIRDGLLNV